MADSIFTKIIKGEIPAHKVHEDNKTLAIMDIHPIQDGMILVVPKTQVSHFFELSDEDYQALMKTVKGAAQSLRKVFADKERIGVIIEGFEMPDHVHVKVFPANSGDEVRALPPTDDPDHNKLAKQAQQLAF